MTQPVRPNTSPPPPYHQSRRSVTASRPDVRSTVHGDDGLDPPASDGARPGRRVTLTGLNAYYGQNRAVKDVSIEFTPNKVTALIGPSGSGKSTVVRCINRMHEEIPGARAEGQVLLDDTDIYGAGVDVVSVRRTIGMVFQKPNPFPTMSIFDNVAAGLRLSGRRGDVKERVEHSLRG